MNKIEWLSDNEKEALVIFHCPGCHNSHWVRVRGQKPVWEWNSSLESPTFTPSIVVNPNEPKSRCHSIITDGKISFQADCHHNLAGQTVDLPNWEESV
jgi:hypothetical protein